MKILFNDLSKQWEQIKEVTLPKLELLFKNSEFIEGNVIEEFEKSFANYIGTKYAIGVSNGTDALKISLASLNLKSKCGIIIPANTFIATILAVTYLTDLKYDIQLIDCNDYYQIDVKLLEVCLKKKRQLWESCVIVPVHLYGHPSDMKRIFELASEFDCFILEDSSQAHGAEVLDKKVGNIGDISAFSLYPAKNLGAAGDAGVITTNNEDLYHLAKSLRNYGSTVKYYYDYRGWNNRLDNIQAIVLNEKLKFLDSWNSERIKIARMYENLLTNKIIKPKNARYVETNVYHIYAIRVKERDKFQNYLDKNNIPSFIHYPIPIQKTTPFKYLDYFDNKKTTNFARELLSLPMHPFLTEEEIIFITEIVSNFYTD